jgi:hypothetical protein
MLGRAIAILLDHAQMQALHRNDALGILAPRIFLLRQSPSWIF